jgi:ribonuclease BN (tRNA processing enzyme)
MQKILFRVTALILLAMQAPMLAAGQQSGEEPFAKIVPSAVIEVRDGPTREEIQKQTQIVVLGTGTPVPDAHRAGSSIAVIHKGEAYLFDIGAGAIQNAVIARYKYDIPSLYPSQICCVFLTHMHSDHTMDYSELAATLWWRSRPPLRAWGPVGLEQMTNGMYEMMAPDTALRTGGAQPIQDSATNRIDVTEIEEGIIFRKDDLTVEAFAVNHGRIKPAYGYRITTIDKTIVISGDTSYSEKLLEKARGVDILFHEVISDSGLARNTEYWQNYHKFSHTLASELGKLASEARPELLVLYHGLFYGVPEPVIVNEVEATYDGEVILANDLDIF